MSIEAAAQTCLFCKRPCDQDNLAVAGMPVCKHCLQGRPQPGNSMGILAPLRVVLRRFLWLLPGMLIGFVLGGVLGLFAAGRVFPQEIDILQRVVLYGIVSLSSGLLGALLLMLLSAIFFFSPIQHAGVDVWKAQLINTLNLQHIVEHSGITPSLVLFCWRRPRIWDLVIPMEIGILLETPQGLIFNGARLTRTTIPFSTVVAASTERLNVFPPRTAVKLAIQANAALCNTEEQSGIKEVYFAFLDEKSFKADREKALAMKERIIHTNLYQREE